MPVVEIYTKTFCPYCWRAKALLEARASSIGRSRSISAASREQTMIQRASGRTTVPQIFIGERHVGGCDDLMALDRAGKLDELLAPHDADRAFPVDDRHRSGSERRALVERGRRSSGRRRGDAVHAGDVGPARPRRGARGEATCAARTRIRCWPRAARRRAQHGIWLHVGSLAVLADDGKVANRGFVIDREGEVRAALRQDPSVRRRPADRRELAGVQRLFARARAR